MDDMQRRRRARDAAQQYLGSRERVLAAGQFSGDGAGPSRHFLLAVTDRHLVALGIRDRHAATPRVRREIARWELARTHVVTHPAPDRPVLVIAPPGGDPVAARGNAGDTVAGALLALGAVVDQAADSPPAARAGHGDRADPAGVARTTSRRSPGI
jgi:hypothetical protein